VAVVPGRAYRSKSAWVSPRRLQSRDVAYRPGLALPDLLQDLTHADSEVVGPKRSTTVSRPHPCGAGSVLTKAGLLRPDEPHPCEFGSDWDGAVL